MSTDERHNICVIDDDVDFTQFVQRYLTAVGHTVRAYTTPQAFLSDLPALDSDIFLVDLMLPGMDGIDLVSLIRAHCEAGIIVVSGRMGADAFTTAPADAQLVARPEPQHAPRAGGRGNQARCDGATHPDRSGAGRGRRSFAV